MWRSKQAVNASSPSFSPAFVATTTIEPEENVALGNMEGNDDLSLDGAMAGPMSLKCHRLTVGRSAIATAEVIADEVIVYGKLTGQLCAGNRIEIKKDASVTGMLTTPRIVIEDGAYFKGSVQIERRKKPRGTSQQHM